MQKVDYTQMRTKLSAQLNSSGIRTCQLDLQSSIPIPSQQKASLSSTLSTFDRNPGQTPKCSSSLLVLRHMTMRLRRLIVLYHSRSTPACVKKEKVTVRLSHASLANLASFFINLKMSLEVVNPVLRLRTAMDPTQQHLSKNTGVPQRHL